MPRPTAPRPRRRELLLLALLVLVPSLFFRGTADMFEVPKITLLFTVTLMVVAWAFAGEMATLPKSGPVAWLRGLASRAAGLPRRDPLGGAVLLYLLSAAISAAISPSPIEGILGAPDSVAGLRAALGTALAYFLARSLPGGFALFDRIATAIAIAAALAVAYALVQLTDLDPFVWGRSAIYGTTLRVFSTLGHPNFLGAYLAMAMPLVLHLAFRARAPLLRAAWLALAASSVVTLAGTLSRAAWIACAISLLAWAVLLVLARSMPSPAAVRPSETAEAAKRSRGAASRPGGRGEVGPAPRKTDGRLLVALATLVVFVAIATLVGRSTLGPALAARAREVTDMQAPSTRSRIEIWRAGLRMAADRPVLGVGLEAFSNVFPAYRTAAYWQLEWGATPTKAHNEVIHILATQGALGGVTALLVVLLAVLAAGRAMRVPQPEIRARAAAATAALIAFALQDLASFTVVGIGVPAAALAGWLAAAGEKAPSEATARSRRPPVWSIALASVLALLAWVPLVARPWMAQRAELRAAAAPQGGPAWTAAIAEAEAAARWNATYPSRLAVDRYERAMAAGDPQTRRSFLLESLAAGRRAVAVEPRNGTYRIGVARTMAELALLDPPAASADEAARGVYEAVRSDPQNAQILDAGGYALYQLGREAEARELELRAASLYPGLAEPMALLGLFALKAGRLNDGLDTLRLALRGDWKDAKRQHASAWSNLSVAYLSTGRFREAHEAASEALRLDSTLAAARDNLAMAERGLGIAPSGQP